MPITYSDLESLSRRQLQQLCKREDIVSFERIKGNVKNIKIIEMLLRYFTAYPYAKIKEDSETDENEEDNEIQVHIQPVAGKLEALETSSSSSYVQHAGDSKDRTIELPPVESVQAETMDFENGDLTIQTTPMKILEVNEDPMSNVQISKEQQLDPPTISTENPFATNPTTVEPSPRVSLIQSTSYGFRPSTTPISTNSLKINPTATQSKKRKIDQIVQPQIKKIKAGQSSQEVNSVKSQEGNKLAPKKITTEGVRCRSLSVKALASRVVPPNTNTPVSSASSATVDYSDDATAAFMKELNDRVASNKNVKPSPIPLSKTTSKLTEKSNAQPRSMSAQPKHRTSLSITEKFDRIHRKQNEKLQSIVDYHEAKVKRALGDRTNHIPSPASDTQKKSPPTQITKPTIKSSSLKPKSVASTKMNSLPTHVKVPSSSSTTKLHASKIR